MALHSTNSPRPQLPAFCRSRRPHHIPIDASSLQRLHQLIWVVLAVQLSSVLLLLAGPVPPAMAPATEGEPTTSARRAGSGSDWWRASP